MIRFSEQAALDPGSGSANAMCPRAYGDTLGMIQKLQSTTLSCADTVKFVCDSFEYLKRIAGCASMHTMPKAPCRCREVDAVLAQFIKAAEEKRGWCPAIFAC